MFWINFLLINFSVKFLLMRRKGILEMGQFSSSISLQTNASKAHSSFLFKVKNSKENKIRMGRKHVESFPANMNFPIRPFLEIDYFQRCKAFDFPCEKEELF